MKITMYTITDCAFSKQEKEYLSSHGLAFEEKNLELNREFLTEMLAVGSNFAGTPVTKIEKDDGQIAVLKGFTAAEFDKTLGLTVEPAKSVEPAPVAPVEQPVAPPVVPAEAVALPVETAPVEVAPVIAPAPVAPPIALTTPDPAMASVLNTLEQQAQVVAPPAPPATGAPVIPDPQF